MENNETNSDKLDELEEEVKVDEETSEPVQENETTSQKKAAEEVLALQQQLAEKDDQILRLSAEISNIQRRNSKERSDAAKYRSQKLAEELISSLDNLERALEIEVGEDPIGLSLNKGIELVYQGILAALATEGITALNPIGETFDPNFHQSISSVPIEDGQQAEEIVDVYQKGYVIKDRVIRPAMVVIAQ